MGGASGEQGSSLAVDSSGNVYSTGFFQGTADFDPGAGVSNITSAGSQDVFVVKLNAPVTNQAPTDLALSANTLNENVAALTAIGNLSTTDPDAGDTFTYTLVSGYGDNAAFSISGGNQLTINSSPDYETKATYDIKVRTTDQGGLFFEKVFAIGINNLDEVAPTITSSNTATVINENSGANQVVYTVTSTDTADIATGATTYSLKNVGDFAAFTIDANSGQVTLTGNPDYETKSSYNFTVIAKDTANNQSEKAVTLGINDINENPTAVSLNNQVIAIVENSSTATRIKVADIAIADDALGTNNVSVSGTDASFFEIDGNALYLKANTALNFEAKTSYSVSVNVDDSTVGSTSDATTNFTLSITNVNEAPTVIGAIAPQAINNGSAFNYSFASNVFADPEGTALTYSISGQPTWLNFNPSTRTFSGTANGVGTSTVTVSASDGTNTTSTNLTLTVNQPVVAATVFDQSLATSAQTIIGLASDDNIFGGGFNDLIRAGDGADTILGNGGNDRLYGDGGNDIIVGGTGTDNLFGGLGSDTFVIQAVGNGLDIINDFQNGVDFIGLSTAHSGGLSFSSLTFTSFGTSGASTSIRAGGTEIMRLINVAPALINNADFQVIA